MVECASCRVECVAGEDLQMYAHAQNTQNCIHIIYHSNNLKTSDRRQSRLNKLEIIAGSKPAVIDLAMG